MGRYLIRWDERERGLRNRAVAKAKRDAPVVEAPHSDAIEPPAAPANRHERRVMARQLRRNGDPE
jgi:hypothetical protein